MNVGDHIDIAAENLARALGLARHPREVGTDEQMTLAVARTQLYRELHRQLVLIAGPDRSQWDLHTVQFGQALRGLTANADMAMPGGLPPVPVRGPVGTAVHETAAALAAANSVLKAHLVDRRFPGSPEGVALAAGYRQPDNLAATGRLAAAALALDERLRSGRWLNPSPVASRTRDLLAAVSRDVRSGWSHTSRRTAIEVARGGVEVRGFVRELTPLPPLRTPTQWATVTSARHAVAAVDAARLFVFHHGGRITAPEMAAIARAGGRISVDIADVLAHTGTSVRALVTTRQDAASHWQEAAHSAGRLRVDPRFSDPAALPLASTALDAVAVWLDSRLRTEPELRTWPPIVGTERATAALRRVVGEIAVRLSDVAEHLRKAADTAQTESRVHHPARPAPEVGRVIQTGKWLAASTTNPHFATLVGSLQAAQRPLLTLANIAEVPMLPGLREVARHQALRRLNTQLAAHSPTTPRPAPPSASPNDPYGPMATSPTPPGRSSSSPLHPLGGR